MVRLMMAHDVLRSGLRWLRSTQKQRNPAEVTEFLVAALTVLGWLHEAIEVLRQGWSQKPRFIHKGLLQGDLGLEAIWKEVKQGKSSRLKRMKRIRNQYLFHFGDTGARKAVDYIKSNDPMEVPFFETVGSARLLDSRYPPAYVALGSAFCDTNIDLEKLPTEMESTVSLIDDVRALLDALLHGMWQEVGLTISEREPS